MIQEDADECVRKMISNGSKEIKSAKRFIKRYRTRFKQ